MAQSPKERLIEAAISLFSEHGFHAVGINQILKESGVAKRTLYRNFSSKEDLIVAALATYDRTARTQFKKLVEDSANDPKGRLLAVFDVGYEWFCDHRFFGCLFINVVSEYSAKDTEIRKVCQDYKNGIRQFIQDLCFQAGLANPLELGDRLFLLFEGATVMAQVSGNPECAKLAKSTAQALLRDSEQGLL